MPLVQHGLADTIADLTFNSIGARSWRCSDRYILASLPKSFGANCCWTNEGRPRSFSRERCRERAVQVCQGLPRNPGDDETREARGEHHASSESERPIHRTLRGISPNEDQRRAEEVERRDDESVDHWIRPEHLRNRVVHSRATMIPSTITAGTFTRSFLSFRRMDSFAKIDRGLPEAEERSFLLVPGRLSAIRCLSRLPGSWSA